MRLYSGDCNGCSIKNMMYLIMKKVQILYNPSSAAPGIEARTMVVHRPSPCLVFRVLVVRNITLLGQEKFLMG